MDTEFPGWLAIDYGTSNTTAILYDPHLINPRTNLPREQEIKLRNLFQEWLASSSDEALLGVSAGEWQNFISEIITILQLKLEKGNLEEIFAEDGIEWQEAICQIELCAFSKSEGLRQAVNKRLYEIYEQVFHVSVLEWHNVFPIILDLDINSFEIPSELEIIGSGNPLKVEMGNRAKRNRLKAIADPQDNLDEIRKRFHHSPKRYLGKNKKIDVVLEGKDSQIEAQQLLQAAWNRLIELTDAYRQYNKEKLSKGPFRYAVVTYPASAPPSVRHQVKKSIEGLGITDVQTNYDEAISSAMFFLWRELGDNLRIGLEAFKTRCHYEQGKWLQNLLVLDIGGGTTDLALIELTLKEINPFNPDEDRGFGGRYYVITPKLLGSSGHLHLGGELITLRIFRLLKAALADCLLTAVSEGSLQSKKLSNLIFELDRRFLDSNDHFRSGTLLASVDQEKPETKSAAYKDALDAAEQLISTRWENAPSRFQAFYTLWDQAEEAKLCLGKTPEPEPFIWSATNVGDLLKQSGIDDYEPKDLNDFCRQLNSEAFALTPERFERAVTPVIQEAVNIANGLVNSREKTIDWLILSGKTCGLELVNREVRRVFNQSDYFVWNPERVTFVADYAKLATSVGACYIELLRRLVFAPKQAKDFLKKGFNYLYVDVQNLSNFLPCYFKRLTQKIGQSELIFKANTPLYQLNSESKGKTRSQWFSATLDIDILREDFDGQQILWGCFDSYNKIAKELVMNDTEFCRQINVQFEINHQLDIKLLFCRGNPHYLIENDLPSIDMRKALSDALGTTDTPADDKLEWDILINVDISAVAQAPGSEKKLLAAGSSYNQVFRYQGSTDSELSQGKGLVSQEWIETFPESGKHNVYARRLGSQEMRLIGEFAQPKIETEYPCRYCVTLDDQGILRFHRGEVPYWTSNQKEVLKNQEGCVYRTPLEWQLPKSEKDRDPFSGIH